MGGSMISASGAGYRARGMTLASRSYPWPWRSPACKDKGAGDEARGRTAEDSGVEPLLSREGARGCRTDILARARDGARTYSRHSSKTSNMYMRKYISSELRVQ